VNTLFDLAAVASAAASPVVASPAVCPSHAPCTAAAGAITRDGVAAAAGHGGYLTATLNVVYF